MRVRKRERYPARVKATSLLVITLTTVLACVTTPKVAREGTFTIYVFLRHWGHVGFSIGENSYDFGRYRGTYTNENPLSGAGPIISTINYEGGAERYVRINEGKRYRVNMSQEIEEAILRKVHAVRSNMSPTFTEQVKEQMPRGKADIGGSWRYAGCDWGILGPHCSTITRDILLSALADVYDATDDRVIREEVAALDRIFSTCLSYGFTPQMVMTRLDYYAKRSPYVEVLANYMSNAYVPYTNSLDVPPMTN